MSCCGICGQDLGTAGIEGHICSHRADAIHDPSDAEINSLHAQLAALGFTVRVTGPDSIGQFTADCLEVPGALGYGGTPDEARLSSMRAILPIMKAREEQIEVNLTKALKIISDLRRAGELGELAVLRTQFAAARADADALAGALEKNIFKA